MLWRRPVSGGGDATGWRRGTRMQVLTTASRMASSDTQGRGATLLGRASGVCAPQESGHPSLAG